MAECMHASLGSGGEITAIYKAGLCQGLRVCLWESDICLAGVCELNKNENRMSTVQRLGSGTVACHGREEFRLLSDCPQNAPGSGGTCGTRALVRFVGWSETRT